MNKKRNFVSETLYLYVIATFFITILGLASISFTISADEETMAAIHYQTTNEINEGNSKTENNNNLTNKEKTNDLEIKNTIIFSSDKFDILEVKILPGDVVTTNIDKNRYTNNYTLWELDEEIKEIIEKIIK